MTSWSDVPAGARAELSAVPAGDQGTTRAGWNAALRRRRSRRTCHVPGCGTLGRLYAAGFLCDQHRPGSPEGGNAA